ncbi:unnamed protein product [Microthlaspi erraticum]|uniref:Ribosomal protein L34e superfamily protein n=1 Tax=Microthlaspi erraticum TaxID=1685480 RepID=A0A6D2LKM3_9BRAS|nr:unnamed protein product [Microthlaspi erraticum]
MLNLLLVSSPASEDDSTSMPPSSVASRSAANHTSSSSSLHFCKHSPSATLDLLILILVLFSGAFLLSSYLSYLIHSLSLLSSHFPSLALSFSSLLPLTFLSDHDDDDDDETPSGFLRAYLFFTIAVSVAASVAFFDLCCGSRSRKCRNPKCKGLKKAMEFDLQLQTEESVKSGSSKMIDRLPWKGGSESNTDYECLRAELRKMAPTNGRAVLLFRSRCGCPVAKLEGWGPKRSRRHIKKSPAKLCVNGCVH